MTREMNKPEWHNKWTDYHVIEMRGIPDKKERTLDDWIKPFFENCCRMEKIK